MGLKRFEQNKDEPTPDVGQVESIFAPKDPNAPHDPLAHLGEPVWSQNGENMLSDDEIDADLEEFGAIMSQNANTISTLVLLYRKASKDPSRINLDNWMKALNKASDGNKKAAQMLGVAIVILTGMSNGRNLGRG